LAQVAAVFFHNINPNQQQIMSTVDDFVERWQLNENSQNLLLDLSPQSQLDVIDAFAPRDTSRDVNGLFISFVKSRTKTLTPSSLGAQPPRTIIPASVPRGPVEPQITEVEVNKFVNTWNLNEVSEKFLVAIPGQIQRDIIEKFNPRDTERDMNGVFLSYAKSRLSKDKGGSDLINVGHVGFPPQGPRILTGAPVKIPPRNAFVSRNDLARKWNLNHLALQVFDSLQTDVQNRVAKEFAPRDISRDVNSVFIAFCRSRAAIAFVDRWQLNEESCTLFSSMEPETQQVCLAGFAPRDTSRDVNAVFQAYVRSRQNAGSADTRGTKRELDVISAFVQQWRLKPDNADLLESLEPELQKEVIAKFSPRDTSRDCNAVFAKFVNGLVLKLGKGM